MADKVEKRTNFKDPNELAERYTAVWMEPDGDRRRNRRTGYATTNV